jgi:hypothetical protein
MGNTNQHPASADAKSGNNAASYNKKDFKKSSQEKKSDISLLNDGKVQFDRCV